jgi:2-polyprenyl-3-methyl-5-hydroxy-6-metoxy-1,4-benzoquinol methylase
LVENKIDFRTYLSNLNPERIIIACQGSPRPPFLHEVKNLFKSLQNFGGILSDCRKIVCFDEPIDDHLMEQLNSMGILVKIVKTIDHRCIHANKIQILNLDEPDFDYLVALDTDIVVAKDFSKFLTGSEIQAKPVDGDPLTINQWHDLFNHFNLELPTTRYLTCSTMTETIPYFNSGVLIIPKANVIPLFETWKFFVQQLLHSYDDLPHIKKYSFFTDQFALALSLVKIGLSHTPLPIEMNFPTHIPIHQSLVPDNISPYLIHYHHNLTSDGKIMSCNYRNTNFIIEKINESLSNESNKNSSIKNNTLFLSQGFDNEKFWEDRYATNIQLGSGIGSREPYLSYKRELLIEILQKNNPSTILDVGCGDLEILKEIEFHNYIGVDLSPTILSRNRTIRPHWNFIQGNFLDITKNTAVRGDLVICFDVLIHQHDPKTYYDFVKAIVDSTNSLGLISSYEWVPRKNYRSEITAYHEPITITLKKFGISKMKIIGVYRDTCIVLFHK